MRRLALTCFVSVSRPILHRPPCRRPGHRMSWKRRVPAPNSQKDVVSDFTTACIARYNNWLDSLCARVEHPSICSVSVEMGLQRFAHKAFDVFPAKVRRSNCHVGRCRDVPVNDKRSIAPVVYLNPYGMASSMAHELGATNSKEIDLMEYFAASRLKQDAIFCQLERSREQFTSSP